MLSIDDIFIPAIMNQRTRYSLIGGLILGSLFLTVGYTHLEGSILTGLILAIISKGMRRSCSRL